MSQSWIVSTCNRERWAEAMRALDSLGVGGLLARLAFELCHCQTCPAPSGACLVECLEDCKPCAARRIVRAVEEG